MNRKELNKFREQELKIVKVSRFDNTKRAVIREIPYSSTDSARQTMRICDWDDRRICLLANVPSDYVIEY